MRICVTGSSGFIGGYVVERLLAEGCEVIAFDRHEQPTYPPGVTKFWGDTRDDVAVTEAVAVSDGVIHLAGVLGTAETIDNPRPSVDTNVVGSLNVFQACRQYNKRCSYITVGNFFMNNSYAITKTTAERFAWMFNREHGTQIAVVRALNAYGPRQKAEPIKKMMPNFILPALRDEDLVVYGDGSQIMDMILVRDVADIMVRALLVDHGRYVYHPTRAGDNPIKFEAGSGVPTTVQEIAELVVKLVGSGRIINKPMRPGEPEGSVVMGDPETLRDLYAGEMPSLTSLEDGVRETVAYYREEMSKNR